MTVYVPVYLTIRQVTTSIVTFTSTITTTATVTSVSVQSLTRTNTRTITSVTTSVTTAVGVLGPVVNDLFKQYSDVGLLATGIAMGTTVMWVILTALGAAAKDAAEDKRVHAEMLEGLGKYEERYKKDRAKKEEERLEAQLKAEGAKDLGWLAMLAVIIALVCFLVIAILSLATGWF